MALQDSRSGSEDAEVPTLSGSSMDALNALSIILTQIKVAGAVACTDGPLSELYVASQIVSGCSGKNADGTQVSYQVLREASKALNSVSHIIKKATDLALQKPKHRKKIHILQLPNETISRIFELGRESERNSDWHIPYAHQYAKSISHVCSRFRGVAINMSILWTELSDYQDPETTRQCVSRSKELPVHIMLSLNGNKKNTSQNTPEAALSRLEAFLGVVHPIAHRWKSLSVNFAKFWSQIPATDDNLQELYDGLTEMCQNLSLPALESASFDFSDWDTRDILTFAPMDLHSSWDMPSLRNIKLSEYFTMTSFGDSVVSCELVLMDIPWSYFTIATFLNRHRSLESVSIEAGFHDFEEWDDNSVLEDDEVLDLPSLRKLKIAISTVTCPEFVEQIMQRFETTNSVEELDIALHTIDVEEAGDCLEQVLPIAGRWERLKTLKILTSQVSKHAYDDILEGVFKHVGDLQHLTIDGIQNRRFKVGWKVPPLRSLTLRNCSGCEWATIQDVAHRLKADGNFDQFEKLEVVNCAEMPKEKAERCIPAEKLEWSGQ